MLPLLVCLYFIRVILARPPHKSANLKSTPARDSKPWKQLEKCILQQRNELQLIFDHVPACIWYKDDHNTILRLNKVAAESMGGTVADYEGKNTFDLIWS